MHVMPNIWLPSSPNFNSLDYKVIKKTNNFTIAKTCWRLLLCWSTWTRTIWSVNAFVSEFSSRPSSRLGAVLWNKQFLFFCVGHVYKHFWKYTNSFLLISFVFLFSCLLLSMLWKRFCGKILLWNCFFKAQKYFYCPDINNKRELIIA